VDIKGITAPIELEVTCLGAVIDPWGGQRCVFAASATINRDDWGVSWNMPLAGGGLLVSNEIELVLEPRGSPKRAVN
jgi:polyisoprenoid-binding protein YceI